MILEENSSDVKAPARLHLTYVDGLRALAALYVVMDHAALQVWPIFTTRIQPVGLERVVSAVFSQAHFAVSVFIVVSGFCLMLPVIRNEGRLKGGASLFFRKRARRILPPYYCAMGLSLLLIALFIGHKTGTHWDCSLPVTWKGFVAHVLLVQDFYGSPQINHVFWSIAVEWQIYFLFPLVVLSWGKWGGIKTAVGSLLLSTAAIFLTRHTSFSEVTPQYFGLFVLGMLGATVAYSSVEHWQTLQNRVPWTLVLLASAILSFLFQHFGRVWLADYFVGTATLALLVVSSQPHGGWFFHTVSGRFLPFIGTFAYSIYLIHAPLLQVVWQYFLHPLHLSNLWTFAILIGIGCPAIVGCAYLFYLICERPFVNIARP